MMAFTPSANQFIENQPEITQKRQSRPSQFASSIQNFKQHFDKPARKIKMSANQLEETGIERRSVKNDSMGLLKCVLPDGRKITVCIVVKRRGSRRMKRVSSYRKVSEKESAEVSNKSPPVQKAPLDLLSKFLLVAEELNKMEQEQKEKISEKKQEVHQQQQNQVRRKSRVRVDRDEDHKIIRCLQRVAGLSHRMQTILDDFIYL